MPADQFGDGVISRVGVTIEYHDTSVVMESGTLRVLAEPV